MAKAGRPGKYCEELVQSICEAVARGLPEYQAAQLHDISTSQFCLWKKKHKGFAERIKKARAKALEDRLEVIRKAAAGGQEYETQEIVKRAKDGGITKTTIKKKTKPEWTAAAWWASRQFCEEFGENRIELKEIKRLLQGAAQRNA